MSSCLIRRCTWHFHSEVPPGVGDVTLLRQEGAAGPGPAAATAAHQPGFHAQLLQGQALQGLNNSSNNSKNRRKKINHPAQAHSVCTQNFFRCISYVN